MNIYPSLLIMSLCLTTFGVLSAHLAYLGHKTGHKTSTFYSHDTAANINPYEYTDTQQNVYVVQ